MFHELGGHGPPLSQHKSVPSFVKLEVHMVTSLGLGYAKFQRGK